MKLKGIMFSMIFAIAFSSILLHADPPANRDINLDGKYSVLIQKLNCPKDKGRYGEFKDYGYWSGYNYCGQKSAPGWWVYKYPHWYVWEKNNLRPEAGEDSPDVNGSYTELVQKVKCPKDKNNYGQFNEYGYWQGNSYCSQQVSSGWWVYVYPYWYIWKTKGVN